MTLAPSQLWSSILIVIVHRYCNGLYRDIEQYDFVGHMGADYARVLRSAAQRYDHSTDQKFAKAIQSVFRVSFDEMTGDSTTATRSLESNRRNRKTASTLQKFYTARTVRRVLEYLAIDYVRLNLREYVIWRDTCFDVM